MEQAFLNGYAAYTLENWNSTQTHSQSGLMCNLG